AARSKRATTWPRRRTPCSTAAPCGSSSSATSRADIHKGVCDVVVCDGFVGNVVLKVCEGVFDFVRKMTAKEVLGALDSERGKAHQAIEKLVSRYDYHEAGGAPLLGIDGICIICHGSSGDRAIKNALGVAAQYARAKLNE